MIKKVFIGVLSALMLFAFVACDNSPSGMVYSIEATQTGVFVEGEEPTAAGFSFTGYTNLGETVSVDASQIVLTQYQNSDTYAISYRGAMVGYVTVDFEPITNLKVDASEATAVYYAVLTAGTDVNAIIKLDNIDYSALDLAKKIGNEDIINMLVSAGAE